MIEIGRAGFCLIEHLHGAAPQGYHPKGVTAEAQQKPPRSREGSRGNSVFDCSIPFCARPEGLFSLQIGSSTGYGIKKTMPVQTPPSANAARTLKGSGSKIHGAQLPGR